MSGRNENYTIGWICAITTELVAAQAFLDERHEGPDYVSPNDDNIYTLGRIGKHNIAIAVLPDGEYGIASAASVARDMLHSFPNIRLGLMVGIGGGAPSKKHDIRLGDIVVSDPGNGNSGVFQYDFGKTIQDQSFQTTGFLNKPPRVLLAAVSTLKAEYESDGHQLEITINGILEKKRKLRIKYIRPHPSTDRLYQSEVVHPLDDKVTCVATCGDNALALVSRPERTEEEDNPAIHYGLVASANQLMKDACVRDKLAAEKNVLCFEMEAAGLMNSFPCLVIRGICDYSDSHKNKEWQGYAAMVAAAYAKDLLCKIPPNRVEAERKIGDVLSGLQEVAEIHKDIAQKQLEIQQDAVNQKLSEKQKECIQLFRLTESTKNVTYESYKDRVEDRVEGTCMWFLKHDYYQEWLKQESGPLLVSADPGCGKSVLAKYLIDHALPRSATICYFFIKDQVQNTVRQALCALLHQLFSQQPSLTHHATKQFDKDGRGLINSTRSLWAVLGNAVQDPQTGSVIIVLDALDECAESEFEDLMQNVESQLRSNRSSPSKLKYLLTSRPYEQIVSKFRGLLDVFPRIRIPGEEESEIISQEVNRVIQYRVQRLAKEKALSDKVKNHLVDRLLGITHRTYLWVYLVFDYLKTEDFKKTSKGVDSTMETLPKSIDQAYEQILKKSKEHSMVRKALSIILAAERPLTLWEMNIAMNIDSTSQSIHDIDLDEAEDDFKSRLRSWCGLFLSIHHGRIYFLHQTAREFLLAKLPLSTTISTELRWRHSITTYQAHKALAGLCVRYLNFFDSDASLLVDSALEANYDVDSPTFLNYSAEFWGLHFREACISDDAVIAHLAWGISNPGSKAYSVWSQIYWNANYLDDPGFSTGLTVASYFGHSAVVQLILAKGDELEWKDDQYSQTPLSWAARNGHDAAVKLLLDKDANLESKDNKHGRTPLSWAARNGHEAVAKLLLNKDADLESKDDEYSRTPLLWAAWNGHETVVKLLLNKNADLESKDEYGQTALSWAAENGYETVVKLLLDKDANLESKDEYGQTPLLCAARNGHETVVKLLLNKDADLESKDNQYGQTPLSWAVENRYEAVVKLLLDKDADPESKDESGRTALSWAAENGYETVVKLLLDKDADLESKDEYGQTPLLCAAQNGHEAVVKLLLDKDADPESKDEYGQTPLLCAARNGHEAVVKLLLNKNADLESKDNKYGQTSLSWAVENRHEAVVKLLLDKDADPESKDESGRTALSWAAENGYETVVKLLLDKDADLESKDEYGQTPLLCAAQNGHEAVVKLLLDKDADPESKDEYGQTPLLCAARNGHEAVVKLLLNKNADLESKDNKYGQTSLSWAAKFGHEAVVKLLLDKGADLELTDSTYSRTALSWAAEYGHEAVVKLLLDKDTDKAGLKSKEVQC